MLITRSTTKLGQFTTSLSTLAHRYHRIAGRVRLTKIVRHNLMYHLLRMEIDQQRRPNRRKSFDRASNA